MNRAGDFTSYFLDIDRASGVFELFFVFVRDDGSAVRDEQTFESAITDILGGVQLPKEALERLQDIHHRTAISRPALYDSAMRLKDQLSRERSLLVMVFCVLLRLAADEGMMSRGDRERLIEVLLVFDFTPEEVVLIPETQKAVFEYLVSANQLHNNSSAMPSLSKCFEVLECTPEASLREIRSSYRRLVKKFHPDRHHAAGSNAADHRNEFQKVQAAYEAITRARNLI